MTGDELTAIRERVDAGRATPDDAATLLDLLDSTRDDLDEATRHAAALRSGSAQLSSEITRLRGVIARIARWARCQLDESRTRGLDRILDLTGTTE